MLKSKNNNYKAKSKKKIAKLRGGSGSTNNKTKTKKNSVFSRFFKKSKSKVVSLQPNPIFDNPFGCNQIRGNKKNQIEKQYSL